MNSSTPDTYTAFLGGRRLASGPQYEVAVAVLRAQQTQPDTHVLVFRDASGQAADLDLRGGEEAVAARYTEAAPAQLPRGRGRPKLGVVAREVTLLPRHWDWLGRQPGGASVALRRLIDDARRVHADRDTVRAAREAAYRFMTAIAGDLAGFEEATRALFAGERERFNALVAPWPEDIEAHLQKLSAAGWSAA